MPLWQAIVLGIVQGLGEFLPISSSAHLALVPWAFGWPDPGLAFDVALHWGTLVAVLAVFWRDWLRLLAAGLASVRERSLAGDPQRHLFWALAIATVPGAVLGKLLQHKAEDAFRAPLLIACALGAMGVLLFIADRVGRQSERLEQMRFWQALAIGLGQACALVPGVSRSGATITLARAFGYTREAAARFSFLMSAPIIFGAGLVKFPALLRALRGQGEEAALVTPLGLAAAMLASAVVGTLVIRWLLQYLRLRSYGVFALYRVAAALAVAALWFSGHR